MPDDAPLKYWKQFVASQEIYKTKVPLFKSDAELRVQTKKIGRNSLTPQWVAKRTKHVWNDSVLDGK